MTQNSDQSDIVFMREALRLAEQAAELGEVPVGALLVRKGQVIGRGFNQPVCSHDPTAHAEMIAIRDAAQQLQGWRLLGCTLYVTLEPCAMCAGAIVQSRLERVVYGTGDPKAGCAGTLMNLLDEPRFNHRPILESGILQAECASILTQFFRQLRRR